MNSTENTLPLTPEEVMEAAETPTDTGFGDILRDFETQAEAEGGAGGGLIKGHVMRITPDGVVVDIGRKMEGLLGLDLVTGRDGQVIVQPGQVLEVSVAGRTEDGGFYRLSVQKVEAPKDWTGIEQAFESKATVTGTVLEVIKGGLRVDVGERAFLPASRSGARDVAEMAKLVGQKIECRITKLDKEKEDVVVDRRVVLEELAAKRKDEAFQTVVEGQVIKGRVRSLTDFGAFVTIGDVDGLLHVSDISWTRVAKAADVLTVGQEVEVKVLKVDTAKRKISLGAKQLMPEPWAQAEGRFEAGQRVQGRVVRLTDFGAFVELLPGVEGLLRTMDMSWDKRVRKPGDVVKVGDTVEVQILEVKIADRRIGLGLKQLVEDPWEAAKARFPLGATVTATVTDLQKFGAFVTLEGGGGVEGMVHVADITREKRVEHPKDVLSVGQTIQAAVTEFEADRRRIRLSMKQLEPTSADHFIGEHQVGEVVTGRVADVSDGRVKVQLAEGVTGICKLAKAAGAASAAGGGGKADVSSLSAMLSARWKEGAGEANDKATPRVGQIRQFRIVTLDAAQKRIDVEFAD